jgi:DNA polymerase-3 subunit alpha
MAGTPFVHLHNHTDYSLLDGACEIGQLMGIVAGFNMPAIAMTDHGNLFGAVEFYSKAKDKGIKPIIGCEAYVAQGSHTTRAEGEKYNHLVLLAENQEGYRNLIKLVSKSHLEGFYYKPRIDKELLAQNPKGLIALSGCLKGEIAETLLQRTYEDGKRLAYQYLDIFGPGNFFLEIQDHGSDDDKRVNPLLVRLSRETDIPLVATNDSHYLRRDDARAHEAQLCIRTGKTLDDVRRMQLNAPEYYLKSRDEMMRMFGEIEDALDCTWRIAERCDVKLSKVKEPFPRFDVPEGHTTDTYFEFVARQGFERRKVRLQAMYAAGRLKHDMVEYEERLDREIHMIQQMKFSGYFLIVWDFIRFSKSQGIPVGPGRGSAAGSLVSYAMGITDLDPIHYGLLFERFLNPERISMPDIDVDFCTHRRGEVIQYVTEKYGREQVAQIITFGTMAAKAAIKDVGRVLGMNFAEVDRITKMVPNQLNITLDEAIKKEPAMAEAGRKDPRVAELLEIAQRLEGMARNASVHAAGVVISPVPLRELVPLYRTNQEEIVTQYDMGGLEKLGLLKMDFLGLKTLTLIRNALDLIEKHRGVKLEIEDLPLEDPKTYELFARGLTSGVFQFESSGMKDLLRRASPNRIEDLTALNALYRPGPIGGGMTDDFIERKHGRRPVTYDLPGLKEILEETYGVIVYQEQVMQIANRIAGYSLGEADLLRRAMGKKKVEAMAAEREHFLEGAKQRGFPVKKAEKLFDLMAEFAGYGFNKSHSAAYAYLAFVTGYLKAHYPLDFMASLLTSETGNTTNIVKYINECREMGIKVLPPDINSSDWNFTPADDGIRFGLGAVKNVGQSAVEAIAAARKEVGKFNTIYQLCETVDLGVLNRRVVESLVRAGAMDSLEGTRAQLFSAVEGAIEAGQRAWKDRQTGQAGLFGGGFGEEEAEEQPLPRVPEWKPLETLAGEKEVLGFYVTGHPLEAYADKVSELATHNSQTLDGLARGAEVALCGVLTGIQRRRNKENKAWASARLEDPQGSIDVVIFATQYEQVSESVVEDLPVFARGLALPEDNGPPKISVQTLAPLEVAHVSMPSLISIRVWLNKSEEEDAAKADALSALFARKSGDTEVRLRLEKPREFSVTLDIGARVRPDKVFRAELEKICGPEAMEILAG